MSDPQTSTELDTINDGGRAPLPMIEPTPELLEQAKAAILDGELPPEIGDPNVTARAIQQRILAGTFEDALAPAEGLPAWREYLDEDVTVFAFHFNPSSFERDADEGEKKKGAYAVVDLMLTGSGEMLTVSCGGGNVLAQLLKAWEARAFPFRCKLIEKGTGTPGRSVLWLERV